VDARPFCVAKRLVAAVHIGELRARKGGDHGPADGAGDQLHTLEVALAGDREPCLDVVHAETGELLGDLELLNRSSEMPGDCSPSRRVVSKITTRSSVLFVSFAASVMAWAFRSGSQMGGCVGATKNPLADSAQEADKRERALVVR
jgi:hypothetical protein